MTFEESIKNIPEQLKFQPVIENQDKLKSFRRIIIAGMGGSALAGDLLASAKPDLDIVVHRDYGLPDKPEEYLKNSLIIANSYSGNTEEVVDVVLSALEKRMNLAVVSVGGELLKLAKENNIPYVQLPDTGIQPRIALGYSLAALLKLTGDEQDLQDLGVVADKLDVEKSKKEGGKLADVLQNKIPIVYSSKINGSIAYNWKINFNETAKIPAFCNVFSEFNHNEMAGFEWVGANKNLSEKFHFIFLKDDSDNPRVLKRMDVCEDIFKEKGLGVEIMRLEGGNFWQKAFNSLLTAVWTAYFLAEKYGSKPEKNELIEEFKKMIK